MITLATIPAGGFDKYPATFEIEIKARDMLFLTIDQQMRFETEWVIFCKKAIEHGYTVAEWNDPSRMSIRASFKR